MANDSTDEITPTRRAAAAALGITEKALQLWTQEPWFPAGAVGKDAKGNNRNWNVTAIRAARDAIGRKGSEVSDTAKKLKLATDNEKFQQAKIRTEQDRLALETTKGELIPRDALELFASTLLTSLGDWCEQLPDLIAAAVPKKYRKPVKDRLKQELDARRVQAAAALERAARDFDTRAKDGINGEESHNQTTAA